MRIRIPVQRAHGAAARAAVAARHPGATAAELAQALGTTPGRGRRGRGPRPNPDGYATAPGRRTLAMSLALPVVLVMNARRAVLLRAGQSPHEPHTGTVLDGTADL